MYTCRDQGPGYRRIHLAISSFHSWRGTENAIADAAKRQHLESSDLELKANIFPCNCQATVCITGGAIYCMEHGISAESNYKTNPKEESERLSQNYIG